MVLYWQTTVVENGLKSFINKQLAPDVSVEYGELKGGLISSVTIKDWKVKQKDGLQLSGNYIEIQYRLWPLLHNRLMVKRIVVDRLVVELPAPAADTTTARRPFNIDTLLYRWQDYFSLSALLGGLPDVDVNNVELVSGTVKVIGQPLTFKNVMLKIARLRLSHQAVFLMLNDLRGRWVEKNVALKTFSFVLKGDSSGLNLNQAELRLANSYLLFNALLTPVDGLNLNLTEFLVRFEDFADLWPAGFSTDGYLKGNLSISGMPVHFGLQGQIAGRWQKREIHKFAIHLKYDRGEVFLPELLLDANFARLKGQAYWNQQKHVTGKLQFNDVNLQQLLGSLPPTQLNGKIEVKASNLRFATMTGHGTVQFYNSLIDTIAIDSVKLAVQAKRGFYLFKKPSFIKIADQSQFFIEGTLDRKRNLDLDLLTFDNSLPHLLRDLGLGNLKGQFDARLHLFGPLSDPDLTGTLFTPGIKFGDVQLDSIDFRIFVNGLLSKRLGNGHFEIRSGKIDRFPIDQISFDLATRGNTLRLEKLRFISGPNFFNTNLYLWLSPQLDSLSIKLFPFNVRYQEYFLAGKDTLAITANEQGINLESFTLGGPANSEITVDGFFDREVNDLQTMISLENLQIAPFEQFIKSGLHIQGRLNGFIELLTPFSDPNLELELSADSLALEGISLGTVETRLTFANNNFTIEKFELSDGDTRVHLSGGAFLDLQGKTVNLLKDTRADLRLHFAKLNLNKFKALTGLHRLQGMANGELELQGRVDALLVQANLAVDRFWVEDFKGDSLRMAIDYRQGKISLEQLNVVLDGSHFSASGSMDYRFSLTDFDEDILNKPFTLHVQSQDNQLMFLGYLSEDVESIQGPYSLDITLGGTLLKPALKQGEIKLHDGQVLLSMIRDPIQHVNFEGKVEQSVLKIETFNARSREEKDFWERAWRFLTALVPFSKKSLNEGYLTAKGNIDLSDLNRPRLDLKLKLDEFYIDYFIQNITLLVTTDNLTVKGRDTLSVRGDLYIPKGMFEVDLNQLARSVYLTEEVVTPEPPFLDLNLRVEIPGNFTVTSSPLDLTNNFRIIFMGDLQITTEPPSDEPRIQGVLEAISGKYASWNQNFIVQSATINFKNNLPVNPAIDFVAVKQIGNKTFELSVNGDLNRLNQDMRVLENGQELGLSDMDKISLLTLGADLSTLQSNPDSALRNMGEKIATTSILTAVERSTEKFTGLDRVEINARGSLVDLSRFRLNNGLSDASIAFGKYLTSDLYVEYRTQLGGNIPAPRLSWDAGNRIGLQYRINRYWTLDSYYEKTDRGNNRIRFGLNWEYSF